MTIRIFCTKFDAEPYETHEAGGKTICQWLTDNAPSFDQDKPQQFSARLNGETIPQAIWPMTGFETSDQLDFTIEPKGTELFFGALFLVAITAMTPKIPKTSTTSTRSGDSFNPASIKGNKVKLNDPIADIAGRTRIYPSYLVPPRRRFADPRTQEVQMTLSLGAGDLFVPQAFTKIGETPFSSLGTTASYSIFPPGASLASESAHEWWHTSEEVGSTSTGNSGLTLEATVAVDPQVSATLLQFSAKDVSVPSGSGWFPVGWAAGMLARIDAPYPLTFTNPAGGGATVVSGQFLPQLKPVIGMRVELTGANGGDYVVNSYTPYSPATSANPGSASTLTGNLAPARYDYNVTPVTFVVGGGPILNALVDTYSWITSTTLPTVPGSAALVAGVAVPGGATGFGYQLSPTSNSVNSWAMLAPTNNAAGWNITLPIGTHSISMDISANVNGTTVQAGFFDGTNRLGETYTVTASRTRYTFNVTITAATVGAVLIYFNRSGFASNSVTVSDVAVRIGASSSAFARGSRSVTLNTATTNISGLVTAINSRISASGISASVNGTVVRLSEDGPSYSGQPITVRGTFSDVFGATPVSVTGSATTSASPETLASMTLRFDDGSPVSGLQAGSVLTGFGLRGLRYRITSVSPDSVEDDDETEVDESHGPSTITVTRLTEAGAEDLTWTGFDLLQTNAASITLDNSTLEGDWAGPFIGCPEGEECSRLEVDVFFPQGLIRYTTKNGNPRQVSVQVEVQYRDFATAGTWISRKFTFTAKSQDQQGYSREFSIGGSYRPEIRMRRIGAESGDTTRFDRVQWYALKARIDRAPTSYAGLTVMTAYIQGGDRLSTQSEALISCVPTRMLPVRRLGAWQVAEATRDIAPYCLYLLKRIGYIDADLDLPEWDRLDAIWRARGDTYDQAHTTTSTVQKILEDCLAAGFAELTVDRGLLRPVRDEPQTVFESMYTPQNMTEELSIDFDAVKPDDYDGVDVEYVDPDSWQTATVPCRLPGDVARRVQKVTAVGVTSRDKAYQIGMRQRRAMKYRRKIYTWSTEMDAFNSRYLSYVQVAGDVPGYAQSALMVGREGNVIEVSEIFDWDVGPGPHYVSLRRLDGTNFGPYVATRVDEFRLQLTQPLDFVPDLSDPDNLPHVLFGIGFAVQVTEISPDGTDSARMEARTYDSRVYLNDNSPAPALNT